MAFKRSVAMWSLFWSFVLCKFDTRTREPQSEFVSNFELRYSCLIWLSLCFKIAYSSQLKAHSCFGWRPLATTDMLVTTTGALLATTDSSLTTTDDHWQPLTTIEYSCVQMNTSSMCATFHCVCNDLFLELEFSGI
jgi:hypothetical protein